MTYCFGDGFDLYATMADAFLGYWDSGASTTQGLQTGRFTGSQCVRFSSTSGSLTKSSGTNDAIHHIVCSIQQTAAITTNLGTYFQFLDGSTGQCCVVFRGDGAILLTSGTPGGTVLATYTNAFPVLNVWYAFEFEVVINNTTGSIAVRKNGNTSNDFSATSLNTRGGTANNYANKITIAQNQIVNAQNIDDILWRSDASSVAWVGDIRCYTRMPVSDSSTQFSRSPSPSVWTVPPGSSSSDGTGSVRYTSFTPTYTGTVGTIIVNINTGFTGNLKCSIFSDNANNPSAVLGSATNIVNPVTGNNTFTFGTPVAVTKGTQYWFGMSHDVTAIVTMSSSATYRSGSGVAYASFPTASPAVSSSQNGIASSVNITPTVNSEFVNEAQQDGTTSYVYDSTVNHVDLYNIATISGSTPSSVVAVTTRGFMEKSDAGTRTGTMQLKSGATTVAATTLSLTSGFQWAWRTDTTDPNTSSAWVVANVDSVTIGPKVIS